MKYFLTFDIGTTAVKCAVFDEALEKRALVIREYTLATEREGFIELDPAVYTDSLLASAQEAIAEAGIDPLGIETISITTQGETLIPVDSEGKPLRRAIVWLDARAEAQAEKLRSLFPEKLFYEETGLPELNGYTPVAKVMWVREKEPEIYRNTWKFLLLEDYILYYLTGTAVTEKCLACSTGWYSFRTDGYWTEILAAAGADPEKFPPMYESGAKVPGGVREEIRRELGLGEHVFAVTGAMDQTAGAVGAGNFEKGRITETTGTALAIGASIDTFSGEIEPPVTVYRHIRKGLYLMLPFCMSAGLFLKWFKDNFCDAEIRRAEEEGVSVYDLLDAEAEKADPGCRGLTALPYLNGTQQPESNPYARGIFFGVALDTKKPEFIRAIMESVACMLKENIELVEHTGHIAASEIHSLGGGAKSDIWCRIKADMLKRPVLVPKETESTLLGVAMLAAVCDGVFPDCEEAYRAVRGEARVYQPDPGNSALYGRLYEKYRRLYKMTEPLMGKE